jgi:K+ transporter
MSANTNKLRNIPVLNWALVHPRVSAWILLSVGMVALLVFEARDVGLLPGQWIALIVATVIVAGACIWIVSWEDGDETIEEADPEDEKTKPSEPTVPEK